MKTQKITLNELKNIVKELIKEETTNELFNFKKKEPEHYIVLPRHGKVVAQNKPYVSSDYVEFNIKKDGIDTVIFYNKTIGDKRARVNLGNNKHSIELSRDEADRLRKEYFK